MKKAKLPIYLVLLCVFTLSCNPVQACDCMVPQPEYDAETLNKVAVIGGFEILKTTKPDWSKSDGAVVSITLKVDKIYHGSIEHDDDKIVLVKNNLSNGCSRYTKEGSKRDLILLLKDGEYWLADQCTDLSAEGWLKMRDKKAGIEILNYEQYHDIASGLDDKKHDIDLFKFANMMKQEDTVVMDLRPKKMFDENHIEGAIHLGADITAEKLSSLIPSKDTTILLYCDYSLRLTRMIALTDVTLPQIYAHGYENIYKLSPVWSEDMKYSNIGELSKILPFTPTKK